MSTQRNSCTYYTMGLTWVFTVKQGQNGLGLQAQQASVHAFVGLPGPLMPLLRPTPAGTRRNWQPTACSSRVIGFVLSA